MKPWRADPDRRLAVHARMARRLGLCAPTYIAIAAMFAVIQEIAVARPMMHDQQQVKP